MVLGLGSCCAGCLALSSSNIVLQELASGMMASRGWWISRRGLCALDSNFKAALTRPSIISLEKPLAI